MENKLLEWFGPDIAYFSYLNTTEREVPAAVSERIGELLCEYGLKRHEADFLMFWRMSTMLSDLDNEHKARAKAITDSLKEWNANAGMIRRLKAKKITIKFENGETVGYKNTDNIEEIISQLNKQRETDIPYNKSAQYQTAYFANGLEKYSQFEMGFDGNHTYTFLGKFLNICGLIPDFENSHKKTYKTSNKYYWKKFKDLTNIKAYIPFRTKKL